MNENNNKQSWKIALVVGLLIIASTLIIQEATLTGLVVEEPIKIAVTPGVTTKINIAEYVNGSHFEVINASPFIETRGRIVTVTPSQENEGNYNITLKLRENNKDVFKQVVFESLSNEAVQNTASSRSTESARIQAACTTPITSCCELRTENTTYTLSTDISSTGTCLIIETVPASQTYANITLDCFGSKITYGTSMSESVGIQSFHDDGVTIKNCVIEGQSSSSRGINFSVVTLASFQTVRNITILNNIINFSAAATTNSRGISMGGTSFGLYESLNITSNTISAVDAINIINLDGNEPGEDSSITNNTITGRISVGQATGNSGLVLDISSNTITTRSNSSGIDIVTNYGNFTGNTIIVSGSLGEAIRIGTGATNFTVKGNTITKNEGEGITFTRNNPTANFFTYIIDTTNTIDGLPVYYYGGAGTSPACPNGMTISPATRNIDLIGCQDVTVTGLSSADVTTFVSTTNSTVTNIQGRGLQVYNSSSNFFLNNNFSQYPSDVGIEVGQSSSFGSSNNNTIKDNYISVIDEYGIEIIIGTGNQLINNSINITQSTGNAGIFIGDDYTLAENNTISVTGVGNVDEGIYSDRVNSTIVNNSIVVNSTGNDAYGIEFFASNSTIENNTIRITSTQTGNNRGYGILDDTFISDARNILRGNTIIAEGTSYGIYVSTSNNTFDRNNVTTTGSDTYAFLLEFAVDNVLNNTLLSNPSEWIASGSSTRNNNFLNTTFATLNGILLVPGSFIVNSSQNITSGRLNISSNRVFVNTTNLTYLNRSAQITLNSISFSNARPVVDFNDDGTFADCDSPQCTEISFSGGTFVFNVSSFTSYSSSATSGVTTGASVTVTKRNVPDPILINSSLNYTITINVTSGNLTNVTVIDTYPPQVNFTSAQPTPDAGTNNTFSLGNLSNGTVFVINITVFVLDNTSNDTVINNSIAIFFETSLTENTTVQNLSAAELNISLTKSDSPDPINLSSTTLLNYTVIVNVTSGTAFNTTLTETYPSQVTFVSAQPTPSGANNTFSLGNLTPGTEFRINITVNVSSSLFNNSVITNNVNLTFQNITGNNLSLTASQGTTVLSSNFEASSTLQFTFTQSDSPDPVNINQLLNYTLALSVLQGLANFTITEIYPLQTFFNTSQPTPDSGSNNQNFTLGSVGGDFLTNISVSINQSTPNNFSINNTALLFVNLQLRQNATVGS